MTKPVVALLLGSRSDLPVMRKAAAVLDEFAVPYEVRVLSAHRCPEALETYIRGAEAAGVQVFVCAAGLAAHLAGAVAARTTLPVIGVPLSASLGGLDALLSTVQMPPGIPVATVGVDAAANGAYLALAILAPGRPELAERLKAFRRETAARIEAGSAVGPEELRAGPAPAAPGPGPAPAAGRREGGGRP